MELVKQNPNLTLDERYTAKLGSAYTYLMYIKSQTPENAVILYPSVEEFFPKDKNSIFPGNSGVSGKIWALRFLYPRKLVLPSEMETNRYAKDITHVAIVNGYGFERLNYPVENKFEHGVLPVNNPQSIKLDYVIIFGHFFKHLFRFCTCELCFSKVYLD
jgi:hypothetical protein